MPPVDGKNVQVTPEDFHTVATQIGHAVAQLGDAATALSNATTAAAGLAGVDDGAKQFDTGYQQALNTLFAAFDRAGDVLTDVALGIDLSGVNHWNADAATVPGGGPEPPWNPVSGLYLPQNLHATSLVGAPVIALPSPLDAKIPLGHQTLLHDLADRFTDAANSVDDVRTGLHNNLTELFANNSSADLDALNTFWNTLGGPGDTAILTAVRSGCRQLSQAVSGFADWIADTQNQILDQVITLTGQIAKQTALAMIPSLVIELFTDGLGGLPGLAKAFQDIGKFGELVAVVEAVEAAAAARLAGGILVVAADANTAMSAAINSTPNPNLDPTSPQTTPGAPNDTTEVQSAENIGDRATMPDFKSNLQQLEKKYKHAADFGVSTPRGVQGFRDFQNALTKFIDDPATVRRYGTYRQEQVIISYNPDTGLAVVQDLDGEFVSGWKLNDRQLQNVVQRGSL